MKQYKKIVKELQPFLEIHHMDLHDRFDHLEAQLARLEAKIDDKCCGCEKSTSEIFGTLNSSVLGEK